MAIGPGKYDEVAFLARTRSGGGVLLVVLDGFLGNGFSVQMTLPMMHSLPRLLREVADQIERDNAKLGSGGSA